MSFEDWTTPTWTRDDYGWHQSLGTPARYNNTVAPRAYGNGTLRTPTGRPSPNSNPGYATSFTGAQFRSTHFHTPPPRSGGSRLPGIRARDRGRVRPVNRTRAARILFRSGMWIHYIRARGQQLLVSNAHTSNVLTRNLHTRTVYCCDGECR